MVRTSDKVTPGSKRAGELADRRGHRRRIAGGAHDDIRGERRAGQVARVELRRRRRLEAAVADVGDHADHGQPRTVGIAAERDAAGRSGRPAEELRGRGLVDDDGLPAPPAGSSSLNSRPRVTGMRIAAK